MKGRKRETEPKPYQTHVYFSEMEWKRIAALAEREKRSITQQIAWIVATAIAEKTP